MKFLDLNGVSILWRRIKTLFARKNETVSNISRNNTTFTVTRADGTTFTFDQKDTTYNDATTSTAGLMSAADKAKLNSVENGAQENIVESVSVNGTKQTVTNKGINITVPTAVSDLNNDLGYLSEESDPTVPSWAKQAQKPVYTASEVGALPDDTVIPTKVSQLTNDSGYLTQHQDISGKANIADLAAVATSGSYNDLSNKPTIPTVPTNVSAFNNDASYADEQYVDDAIATALADITGIEYHVCTNGEYNSETYIPTLQGEYGVIYLVPKPSANNNNIYYEYIYTGTSFEKIGDTEVDLDGYLEEDDISSNSDVSNVLTEVFSLDRYATKTASGAIASFSDGADDAPVKNLTVGIELVQAEGTPSPDNIMPISGWDAVKVYRSDKNLWGGRRILDGVQHSLTNTIILDEDAGTISFTNAALASDDNNFVYNVKIKENTQYTFIMTYDKSSNLTSNMRLYYTDGSYDSIPPITEAGVKETVVLVTDANKTVASVRRVNSGGRTILYYDECCLLEGVHTADDFVPYVGDAYDITLPQTVYGGTLDVTTGVLSVDTIKKVFDGTETLYYSRASTNQGYAMFSLGSFDSVITYSGMSNMLKPVTSGITTSDWSQSCQNSSAYKRSQIAFRLDSSFDGGDVSGSIENYKAELARLYAAGTPIEVCYKINTPTTITLSPTEVRTLLGQNNIWSDTGNVDVEYRADNV